MVMDLISYQGEGRIVSPWGACKLRLTKCTSWVERFIVHIKPACQPACGSEADIYPPLEDPAIGAKVYTAGESGDLQSSSERYTHHSNTPISLRGKAPKIRLALYTKCIKSMQTKKRKTLRKTAIYIIVYFGPPPPSGGTHVMIS